MKINTIKKSATAEIQEKKSKFIANIFNVNSKAEAENRISEIKKKYCDAKHNCFAFVIIENGEKLVKSSDNGEPSGTAGMPILNAIEKNNLTNVLIVITRYFGGILLGTGGLTRAYSNASIEAIKLADIVTKESGKEFKVELGYEDGENFKYYCMKNKIKITDVKYNENIYYIIEMNDEKAENFLSDFNSKNSKLLFEVKKIVEASRKYAEKEE